VARAVRIKTGNVIRWRDELWKVLQTQQTFVGKKGAYIQIKLQNLDDGHIETNRFASSDQVEKVFLEERRMEYLYEDGVGYVFMDPETGEQTHIEQDLLGEATDYLAYNTDVQIQFHEGRPIGVELPPSVTLEVTKTEPAVRGDTATSVTKPAEVETGLVVKVPGHIKKGENIQVNTRTGEFLGRA